jgi:energy-coupling factor transport system permease protein
VLEKAMSAFFFLDQDSPLHRLDPRVKITGLFLFCLLAIAGKSISLSGLMSAMLLSLFLIGKSGRNLKKMAGFFTLIAVMIFMMWILFYRSEEKLWAWKYFAVYSGAASYAAAMSLRFLNMLLSGLLFLSITSIEDFFGGMIIMRVPYPFAFAVSLSFRLVMVFMSNAFTIVEAQRVRGNDITQGGLVKRIKAYAPLLTPLILTGIKKAETLTLALESKGFSPQNKMDFTGKYSLRTLDKCCLCAMFLAGIAAVSLRLMKGVAMIPFDLSYILGP